MPIFWNITSKMVILPNLEAELAASKIHAIYRVLVVISTLEAGKPCSCTFSIFSHPPSLLHLFICALSYWMCYWNTFPLPPWMEHFPVADTLEGKCFRICFCRFVFCPMGPILAKRLLGEGEGSQWAPSSSTVWIFQWPTHKTTNARTTSFLEYAIDYIAALIYYQKREGVTFLSLVF